MKNSWWHRLEAGLFNFVGRRLETLLLGRANPARRRPHLGEPNYYRLGYQLSAQLLNRERARRNDAPDQEKEKAPKRDTEAAPLKKAREEEPWRVAEEVLESARTMSGWYSKRDRQPSWQFWLPRLRESDKRLRAFLTTTVEPCLEIVIAASKPEPDSRIDLDRLRACADRGQLSPRAIYSLACFEAAPEGRGRGAQPAYDYLSQALRGLPVEKRHELARWAARDPALRALDKDPGFHELLRVSEIR